MSISFTNEFVQICREGDMSKFNNIYYSLSSDQKTKLIESDNYACFHFAASNGHYEIVNIIFNHIKSVTDEDEMFSGQAITSFFESRNGETFKIALSNHHIQTVKLILTEEFLF